MRVFSVNAAGHAVSEPTHLQVFASPGQAPLRREQQKQLAAYEVNVSEVQKTAAGIHFTNDNQLAFLVTYSGERLEVKPFTSSGSTGVDIDETAAYARLISMSRETHILMKTMSKVSRLDGAINLYLRTVTREKIAADDILPKLTRWFASKIRQVVSLAEVDCMTLEGKALLIDSLDKDATSAAIAALGNVAVDSAPAVTTAPTGQRPVPGFSEPAPGSPASRRLVSCPAASLFKPTTDSSHGRLPVLRPSRAMPAGTPPKLNMAMIAGGSAVSRTPLTPRADSGASASPVVAAVAEHKSPEHKVLTPAARPPATSSPASNRSRLWRAVGVVATVAGMVFVAKHNKTEAKKAVKGVAKAMRP
ncbi:MAG: hypothetical protein P1U34_10980 [Coxiellaceae bacterium]|nr:hypothetical protein [Coxiellaceae bacterium]